MSNYPKINLFPDKKQKGIWQFSDYLSSLNDHYKLSLGEGNTEEINVFENLVLKREDSNPTGSLKDRGMAYLISRAYQDNQKNLVLSSSGNAAISAAKYCSLAKINLFVFVSPEINEKKLALIESSEAKVVKTPRPVSDSLKFSRENGYLNIRPSLNNFGGEGYQTIAFELAVSQKCLEDIFIPVSSGVALVGIARGFKKIGYLPRFHLCQSSAICPIAKLFDKNFIREDKSLASSLVARYTPLKKEIINILKESSGTGWVIENKQISEAQNILKKQHIETSAEGSLAFAAWRKAKESKFNLGHSVCLLTGRKYE